MKGEVQLLFLNYAYPFMEAWQQDILDGKLTQFPEDADNSCVKNISVKHKQDSSSLDI